jgi:hypothetical protein
MTVKSGKTNTEGRDGANADDAADAVAMDKQKPLSPRDGGFVIQFRTTSDVTQARFAGRVEHVASGKVGHFRTPEELRDFVSRVLRARRTWES